MLNITQICKAYHKLPGHFRDNNAVINHPDRRLIQVVKGKGGSTSIPLTLAAEFFLWLHPETRQQILDGVHPSEVKFKTAYTSVRRS